LLTPLSFDFPRALEVTVVRCQFDNRVVNQVQKMKALSLHAGYNVSNEISSKFGGQLLHQAWCEAAQSDKVLDVDCAAQRDGVLPKGRL
jgi:hypothetical protein